MGIIRFIAISKRLPVMIFQLKYFAVVKKFKGFFVMKNLDKFLII